MVLAARTLRMNCFTARGLVSQRSNCGIVAQADDAITYRSSSWRSRGPQAGMREFEVYDGRLAITFSPVGSVVA